MPAPHPPEFRDDVVRVARNREPGQKLAVIATRPSAWPEARRDRDPTVNLAA
ncbi:hypothetical protein [Brachybacterium sp. GPGPB12]|uniref:hypothetical protein n=1 Tax=Brachybacterium sp. GPGPB12 TaxID=3023517 RepID=UPI0031343CE9